jgi:putative selenate reductase
VNDASGPPRPLYPWSLSSLLQRVATEWESRNEIFSLAGRRFFRVDEGPDLSAHAAGGDIATPVGPAAGPHTQLAQNLVLAWLAGARSFELKTVQVLDDLEIGRPCIDMENVGYNVEWSQELSLEESLHEYIKAALMLEVLGHWEPLREVLGDPGRHIFEVSAGYDLAGVQSDKMTRFFTGLRNWQPVADALRREITGPFAGLRDVPLPEKLAPMATLSTFHGCPPAEIEGIVRHLMTAHDLDVTVKLNPTLLGEETVAEILHGRLGYEDVQLVPEAFAEDLQWERALEMIDRLSAFARENGRTLGLKLTNTLVVANARGVLPGERMYLSGRPLHVLAVTLLDRLDRALGQGLRLGTRRTGLPVAFSAGIDKDNLAAAVSWGLNPVTVCSDLLKPGGYGRLAQGLRKLRKGMVAEGCADLPAWLALAEEKARTNGHETAVAQAVADLARPDGFRRYSAAGSHKPLRQVDNVLQEFDCVACNNCVSVCPNNAFLALPTPEGAGLEARHQYLVLAELCNECGNCTTFCPEEGAPHEIKPALFTSTEAWSAHGGRGYFLEQDEQGDWCVGGAGDGAEQVLRILDIGGGLPLGRPADEKNSEGGQ